MLGLILLAATLLRAPVLSTVERPNILFIFTDGEASDGIGLQE